MKVQRVKVAEHQYIWLVLDDSFLPVQPIEVFIRYLHHTEKSPDTINKSRSPNVLHVSQELILFISSVKISLNPNN